MSCPAYSSLYLLPEEVVTTSPALAPRLTGEVVISVPLRKFFEFLTIPVMEPSGFCVNLLTTGTSSATTLGGAVFLAPDPPKREKPPDGLGTTFCLTGSGTGAGLLGVEAVDPPKMLKVPLPLTGVLGAVTGAGGGVFLDEESEIVPGPLACFVTEMVPEALAGGVVAFFGAPKEENPPIPEIAVGVDFFTGAFFSTGGF